MHARDLVQKLRSLKKQEKRIRFGHDPMPTHAVLEWNSFFADKPGPALGARHSFDALLDLDAAERKAVFEEFFYRVYLRFFEENGLFLDDIQDPTLLDLFGLPPGATPTQIKSRFREMAKQCHPDCGGDAAKMRELLDAYHSLLRP